MTKNKKTTTVEVSLPAELLDHARELRKNLTDAEEILWQLIRNGKLNNLKFRRQHPLTEGIIFDFYCAETRLAIELDGACHRNKAQKENDKKRTEKASKYGIRVIRFWNGEVITRTESVLRRIKKFSSSPPAPLQAGEGRNI